MNGIATQSLQEVDKWSIDSLDSPTAVKYS